MEILGVLMEVQDMVTVEHRFGQCGQSILSTHIGTPMPGHTLESMVQRIWCVGWTRCLAWHKFATVAPRAPEHVAGFCFKKK